MAKYIFSLMLLVAFVSLISLDNPSSPLDKQKKESPPFVKKTSNASHDAWSAAWSAAKLNFWLTGAGLAVGHANIKKKRPVTPAVGGGAGAVIGIGITIREARSKQEDYLVARLFGGIAGSATAFLVASIFNIFA